MASGSARFVVATARPEQRAAALGLFFQHLDDDERAFRVERVGQLIASGEVAADGLLICSSGNALAGAVMALALPGATGMVWPPGVQPGFSKTAVEDLLVQHANHWLEAHGCRFGQALLQASESSLGVSLARNGYSHITNLLYLQKLLTTDLAGPGVHKLIGLTYQGYIKCDREVFHSTLLASYEDTLDCPELNDTRTAVEILAGYQAVENCRPDRWSLAWHGGKPVGVLLLTESSASTSWDLSYLGVPPAARGRGVGRTLTLRALHEAHAAGALRMTLTLDRRNEPAWQLYRGFGFEVYQERMVYLTLFGRR
jgi:ribosomal protein S18 acetylase RimI-like enzyme